MKLVYLAVLATAIAAMFSTGCRETTDSHPHGPDTHDHGETTTQSKTVHSGQLEVFVEYPGMVAGNTTIFTPHFTDMATYKPVTSGQVALQLLRGNRVLLVNGAPKPISPGIYQLSLTPEDSGEYILRFILQRGERQDTVDIAPVFVYGSDEEASAAIAGESDAGDIAFTKEQAWSIAFAIEQVKRDTISDVIRTSGNIEPVKGEERIVSAKTAGLVFFQSNNLQPGREVRSGEHVFTIKSQGLLLANLETKYNVAKAHLDQARADFERAEQLLGQQIIGQKQFEERKRDFEVAQAEFSAISESFADGGQSISAPIAGIVKNVFVTDGQFVREGDPLIEITRNRKLILHADVSQRYLPKLAHIHSANFKTPYQEQAVSIDQFKGRLVTRGQVIEPGSGFIPLLFELDNVGQLVPGSFAEVFLLATPIPDALVIPRTALIEEYNAFYVFVQTGGEQYARRQVQVGVDDGQQVQVLSGVEEGDWVVTKGAFQIKLASMSGALPAHGHEH